MKIASYTITVDTVFFSIKYKFGTISTEVVCYELIYRLFIHMSTNYIHLHNKVEKKLQN